MRGGLFLVKLLLFCLIVFVVLPQACEQSSKNDGRLLPPPWAGGPR